MTEYGRGRGSEPWHPEDPLFGDQGWTGHQTQQGQVPYSGDPQQQYGQQPQEPQHPQHPQQQQYPAQEQGYAPQYPQQLQPQQSQQPQPQQPQPQQPQYQQPVYDAQGWDTGQGQYMATAPADPYAGVDPYAQQRVGGYPGEAPDLYTTDEAYPPPQPPGRRHLDPDPAEQEEDDSVFAAGGGGRDGDDGGDGDDPAGGGRRGGRSKGGKSKQRSGAACLIATLVIVGVLGGGGYYGYTFIKDKFGAAEDYTGEGTGSVSIDIPKGTGTGEMGRILKAAGVVKSASAFVAAAQANPKGKAIQAGSYAMKEHMSAKAAVELMVNGAGMNALDVIPGWRNVQVYAAIDQKLKLKEGTTKDVAAKDFKSLGLPDWANDSKDIKDPLEGFLYPARYDLSKDATPQSLLQQMVARANEAYGNADLKAQAAELGLKNPLQLVTVASLVQAEGKYQHDFDKISRVVYNRLKPGNTETYGLLDFDSTVNYIKGQSTLDIGSVDELRKLADPYNTYKIRGLPAGPIGNPGPDALKSALNPTDGPWYYFVSVNEDETLFAVTNAEHNRNRERYEEERKKTGQ